jgi:cytochrome c oxidase assembly protein subunit 15
MIASFVGFLTIILAILLWRKEPRKWIRNLGILALFLVILQGVLGGITVLWFLPTPISVMHATLAQTFFCLSVSIVIFTSKWWKEAAAPIQVKGKPWRLFVATTIAIYGQLILGAWMRHSGAALAIPTFPLAFGRLIPPFQSPEIVIHFAHRIGALIVLTLVVCTASVIWKRFANIPQLRNPALLLVALTLIQILLGGYTVLTQTAVPVATAHVAVGALILATSVALTIRSYRILAAQTDPKRRTSPMPVTVGRTA